MNLDDIVVVALVVVLVVGCHARSGLPASNPRVGDGLRFKKKERHAHKLGIGLETAANAQSHKRRKVGLGRADALCLLGGRQGPQGARAVGGRAFRSAAVRSPFVLASATHRGVCAVAVLFFFTCLFSFLFFLDWVCLGRGRPGRQKNTRKGSATSRRKKTKDRRGEKKSSSRRHRKGPLVVIRSPFRPKRQRPCPARPLRRWPRWDCRRRRRHSPPG